MIWFYDIGSILISDFNINNLVTYLDLFKIKERLLKWFVDTQCYPTKH